MKSEDKKHSLAKAIRKRIPYKMLGKRFGNTNRLMVSSKVWQRTIPTNNCDILLTFPAKVDDSTLMWLLARLKWRVPQVVVNVRHHSNSGIYGFYITASYENLLKGADDLAIQKPLKTEYGGGLKEFTFEDQECFSGVEEERAFLTSQERQAIVYYMLNNLRAEEGEELGKIKFLEGQPIVPLLESKKIISQVFPLHNSDDLDVLNKKWVQAVTNPQPVDLICEYFGVKIALYFAYLGHYTLSLILPTVLGIILWISSGNQGFDDFSFVFFAVINVMWATLFLEYWKRTSSELAYRWGTLDKKDDLLEDPRPLFKGDLVRNSVTDRVCFEYPPWKRNLFRYFVTVPVIFTCLLVVFIVMLLIFELQEWITSLITSGDLPGFVSFLPKIMLALSIGILDDIYKKIAYWLNDQENYRLETTYEKALIIKLVLFQFVNSFLSLFYIAFYLQDMNRLRDQLAAILITRQVIGNLKEVFLPYFIWKARLLRVGYKMTGEMSPGSIAREVVEMTSSKKDKVESDSPLMTSTPVANSPPVSDASSSYNTPPDHSSVNTSPDTSSDTSPPTAISSPQTTLPSTDVKTDITDSKDDKNHGPVLTQAENEAAMKPYTDTWEDYMEMVIQFGYVSLFSSAFPLAALCAFINNVIEIRSDAFKLCFNHQRPFGKRVESIGIWQDVMEAMGIIAVIVNCALIGTSGIVPRISPDMPGTSIILLIVIIEHVLLLLKFILAYAIPDVPSWVAAEKAKWEFKRRVALKRLESQNTGSSPDVKSRPPFKPDGGSGSSSSQSNQDASSKGSSGQTEEETIEKQTQSRNLMNANLSSTNQNDNIVSRSTERPTRRLSESSTGSDGQRRVMGRRQTDYRHNGHRQSNQRHSGSRENSRNTSPMHTYSFDERYDRAFSYSDHDRDHKDISPANSTKSNSRSPLKTQLLDEYIASYNSALAHDRSQMPSNKYLDSRLRSRNLSPIKVSTNPGQWRSNRSPSPAYRTRPKTPNSRPTSPITNGLSSPSPSPSPTDYKMNAPFATEIASPTPQRRRTDIVRQQSRQQSPLTDPSKNYPAIERKQQYISKNVGDCLRMESKIPVAGHHRSTAASAPFALSLD